MGLKGIDITKYIASGVVVFDLRTRGIVVFDLRTRTQKWVQHLDLSTDNTTFKAYAYAAPTLVDLNRDGFLEIVVGASMGFLYVLNHKGNALEGWPMQMGGIEGQALGDALEGWPIQMGSIEGQALVADLNNDGEVEIVAGDSHGNIACFNVAGEEVWSRHGATAADVDGDGDLEVVFGTVAGYIFALRGATGEDIPNFPFRTHGRIHAPVMVTRLADTPSQHLVVMSFDGFLYLVDGAEGCADTIDIGEMSYSTVLADDLDGDNMLDLLVTTMNGNVYAFQAPTEYHPLKTWPSQVVGLNGMVQINLVDKRMIYAPNGSLVKRGGPYNVSVVLKGVGVQEMNAGSQPVIGVADTIQTAGLFSDEFALSFHLHFHKLFKWMVALPLVVMVIMLLAMKRDGDDPELPSYSHLG
eukprot:gene7322-442_t